MASLLGTREGIGVLAPTTGPDVNRVAPAAWVIRWRAQVLPSDADFEVYHAAVRGPGGYFVVYIDDKLYGVSQNGQIAEYGPSIPMYIRKGQEISFHWSISTPPAPTAILYLRTPEVGRL